MIHEVIQGDCEKELEKLKNKEYFKGIHLTFLDPPFNQGKDYNFHNDNMSENEYWDWMQRICKKIYDITIDGGSIYFMQREKNTDHVIRTLRNTGWTYQNLIIWLKLTSGIPSRIRYGKRYQIIAFFTKGKKPLTFNNLRYEPPLLAIYENERETGIYLTDVWEDIRELTSGYLAGDEAIRMKDGKYFTSEGERFHKQQSPVELLTRIILSSSKVGDYILDPFSGTGTTAIVAKQLNRNSINIELDPKNVEIIKKRLKMMRASDNVHRFYSKYIFTEDLDIIWYGERKIETHKNKNYNYDQIKKIKLNNTILMKDTIYSILIDVFNIPKNIIDLNYRLRDRDGNIHRFDIVLNINLNKKIFFRLVFAKSIADADIWIKRINYEKEIINENSPDSQYFAIISGIAFKSIIKKRKYINEDILVAFPGWGSIFNIDGISEKESILNIFENFKFKKQISLDYFR